VCSAHCGTSSSLSLLQKHTFSFLKIYLIFFYCKPDIVVQAYNLSTWEAEKGGAQVQSQPGLHTETLSQKTKQNKITFYYRNCQHITKVKS
jgi:hypothetical protein